MVVHGCEKEGRKASKADLDVARKRMKQVLGQEALAKQCKKK